MAGALEIIEVIAEGLWLGQQVLNVWNAISPSAVADSDLVEDLRDGLDDLYQNIKTGQDPDFDYISISFRNLSTNEDLGTFSWPALVSGTAGASESLPPGVAALLTFPTSVPGTRGRKFLPGLQEGTLEEGVWTSSMVTVLEAMAADVLAGFIGSESGEAWAWGVKDKNGVFRPFTDAIVTNIPAYQRRRRQGVGA